MRTTRSAPSVLEPEQLPDPGDGRSHEGQGVRDRRLGHTFQGRAPRGPGYRRGASVKIAKKPPAKPPARARSRSRWPSSEGLRERALGEQHVVVSVEDRNGHRDTVTWCSAEPCSIGRAMEVLGERWTFLIVREAFFGVRRFTELQRNLGIARNILSVRLQTLTRAGILERIRYQAEPERYEYKLTTMGRDLYPAIVSIMRWATPTWPATRARRCCCSIRSAATTPCRRWSAATAASRWTRARSPPSPDPARPLASTPPDADGGDP